MKRLVEYDLYNKITIGEDLELYDEDELLEEYEEEDKKKNKKTKFKEFKSK